MLAFGHWPYIPFETEQRSYLLHLQHLGAHYVLPRELLRTITQKKKLIAFAIQSIT